MEEPFLKVKTKSVELIFENKFPAVRIYHNISKGLFLDPLGSGRCEVLFQNEAVFTDFKQTEIRYDIINLTLRSEGQAAF